MRSSYLHHSAGRGESLSTLILQVSADCMLVHTKQRNLAVSEFLESPLLKQLTVSGGIQLCKHLVVSEE